ncbi:hypothetical protein FN846DRAFT_186237 [Sphaerosporella brunnea]|uniref:Uncharacterized protein n=1 Tax=Sphaerosporella brunnea TaxID=1250544 RepID=A0A5J5EPX4_9PEZI|nr:hypothetical protein FN846DRAFT_186237 [Sphaerosporella brunnea]
MTCIKAETRLPLGSKALLLLWEPASPKGKRNRIKGIRARICAARTNKRNEDTDRVKALWAHPNLRVARESHHSNRCSSLLLLCCSSVAALSIVVSLRHDNADIYTAGTLRRPAVATNDSYAEREIEWGDVIRVTILDEFCCTVRAVAVEKQQSMRRAEDRSK